MMSMHYVHRAHRRRRIARGGVTLIELIVAMVLATIIMAGMVLLLVGPTNLWRKGGTQIELQRDMSLALDRIAGALREARWMCVTNEGRTLAFRTPTESGTIFREGTKLVIEIGDDRDDQVDNLAALSFSPLACLITPHITMSRFGESLEGECTIESRNVRLVLHVPFNEGSGITAFDQSGSGNNGALYGTTWISGAVSAHALRFVSSRPSYVEVPDAGALNTGDRAAFEFNAKLSGGGSTPTLYSRGARSTSTGFQWVYVDSSGRIVFQGTTGSSYQSITSDALTWDSAEWYRICVVLDNTVRTCSFWRDGEHAGTVAYSSAFEAADSGIARIGTRADQSGAGNATAWNGAIDEVIVASY